MDWKYLLTSFDGRINRQPYWFAILALVVALVVIFGIAVFILPFFLYMILAVVVYIVLLFFSCALGVKRLHDRGKGWHWLLVFFGIPIIIGILNYLLGIDPTSVMGMLTGLISLAVSIWALVELGFLRGTDGPNEYGPDPLQDQ